MKRAASLILGAVLLTGCGRGQKKAEATAPSAKPAPVASAQPRTNPAVVSASSGGIGQVASISKPSVPSPVAPPSATQPGVVPPAVDTPEVGDGLRPGSVAPEKGTPEALADFSIVPLSRRLRPDSAAAREIAKAQELFRQGRTDAALAVLSAAVTDPDLEGGRAVLVRMQVATLLASGRLDEAKALSIEYATGEQPEFTGPIVTRYLITEKGDAAAAVAWTDQVATLPLKDYVATLNHSDRLVALASAGRLDEVVFSLPAIVTKDEGLKICVGASLGMIKVSNFDGAERFISSVGAYTGDDPTYTGAMKYLSAMLESSRAGKTNAVPGI